MAKLKSIAWKEINKLAEETSVFFEDEPERFLTEDVKPFQEEVMKKIEFLLYLLALEGDRVKKNNKNLFLVAQIDNEIQQLFLVGSIALITSLLSRVEKTISINFTYYTTILGKSNKLNNTKKEIESEINDRFGIDEEGKVVDKGFIWSAINNSNVRAEIMNKIYNAIYSRGKLSSILQDVRDYLLGKEGRKGAYERDFGKYTDGIFDVVDRIASEQFRVKHNLKWFIYAGRLWPNSRPFCRKKLHGVFSYDESLNWMNETPHPLGVAPELYNPIIHMGGVNCKHCARFITEEMKIKYERYIESLK